MTDIDITRIFSHPDNPRMSIGDVAELALRLLPTESPKQIGDRIGRSGHAVASKLRELQRCMN